MRSFSLLKRPSPLGVDGALCPNCGVRVRLKLYGLVVVPWLVAMLPFSLLAFPWAPWAAKVAVAVVGLLLFLVILHFWPLTLHPWARVTDASVSKGVKQ